MPEKDTPQAGLGSAEQQNKDILLGKNENGMDRFPYEPNSPISRLELTLRTADKRESDAKLPLSETTRKEILRETESVLSENLDMVLKTVNVCLKHRNPYPYESRQNQEILDSYANRFRHIGEFGTDRLEAKAYMEKTAQDVEYLQAWQDALEGFGAPLPFHFGGIDKMMGVMGSQRNNLTSSTLDKLYYRDDPNFNLSVDEKDLIKTRINPTGKEEPTLRELGVKYNSDATYWTMTSAAMAQWDYLKDDQNRLMPNIQEYEKKFVARVFGMNDKVENLFDSNVAPAIKVTTPKGEIGVFKKILNYYSNVKSANEKNAYSALMQALLISNAKERLRNCVGEGGGGAVVNQPEIDALVAEVKGSAKEIYNSRKRNDKKQTDNGEERAINEKLAELAVKTTIVRSWAFMNDIHYCWGYDYQGGSVREVENGGIYVAGDDYTPAFPFFHNAQYDATPRARSSYMPPSSRAFNEQILRENPKNTTEIMMDDSNLIPETKELLDKLLLGKPNGAKIPEGIEFTPGMKDILKSLRWNYLTAFRDKDGKEIAIPMFVPLFFNWDVMSGFAYDKVGTTYMDYLRKGQGQLSDLSFSKGGEEEVDGMFTNWNMGARWLHLLMESPNGDIEEAFFGTKSTEIKGGENPNVKELNKRVFLAVRKMEYGDFRNNNSGEKLEVRRARWEMLIGGQLIPLYLAKKYSMFSNYGLNIGSIDDSKTQLKEAFAKWLLRVQYLPKDWNYTSEKEKGYSDYMQDYKTMLWLNLKVMSDLSKNVSKNEHNDLAKLQDKIVADFF
jgi:hypothetical protein